MDPLSSAYLYLFLLSWRTSNLADEVKWIVTKVKGKYRSHQDGIEKFKRMQKSKISV